MNKIKCLWLLFSVVFCVGFMSCKDVNEPNNPNVNEPENPNPNIGITYNVTVPAGTKACYIAGAMNNWSFTEMTKVDDTHYTLELADATAEMEYKYCSGPGWAYVENTANGDEVSNRKYYVEDVVEKWASVYDPGNVPTPGETKDITIKAKVPAEWTDEITAWVWDTGEYGREVIPNKGGEWYVYTQNCVELNIIFKNGTGWMGNEYQTVDITLTESACIEITAGSDKATYTHVDCTPNEPTVGTENGYEWVDLGLSVKWATCNVGANKPEGCGDYFAWGETTTKSNYEWSTYKYCNGSYYSLTKYNRNSSYGTVDNKTTLELCDDAAHANWGGRWRMPTKAEQDELRENCTWTWTTQNCVNGYRVTSRSNGNSIFLPATGYRFGSLFYLAGIGGYYWSSSLDSRSYIGDLLFFHDIIVDWGGENRYIGCSVRSVCP